MKQGAIIFILIMLNLGLGGWAFFDKRETEEFMLRMLYLDSITHINNNIFVLTSLREGSEQQAVNHLERLLETKLAILEGCKNDLCSEEVPQDIREAIKLAEEYRGRYGSAN